MTRKKRSNPLPTVDEFLGYRPVRGEFPWRTGEDGRVSITVPKFTGKTGVGFVKMLRKENTFVANLDALGSFVWVTINGEMTVRELLGKVKEKFPTEQNIDQRLFLFLQQMGALHYLMY